MSSSLPKLRLLVISPLPNDAEQIGSHLRNAGHAARTRWSETPDKAVDLLREYHTNLIICADDIKGVELCKSVEQLLHARPDAPLLVLGEHMDQQATIDAIKLGAQDRIVRSDLEHLGLVVLRELSNYRQAQDLLSCQAHAATVETRHDALLMDSNEAIAYVHEGIHTRANPVYAELFGYEDIEQLDGLPIMDLVEKEDRDQLKSQLRACASGEELQKPASLRGRRSDSSALPVNFHFSQIRIGDTEQVEIIARAANPEAARADHDHATDRRAAYQALKQACEQEVKGDDMPSLLYIVTDGFEEIQANIGYAEADQLLDDLAATLKEATKGQDRVLHFFPGEMLMFATRPDEDALQTFAQQLCLSVKDKEFESSGRVISATVSIAVCPLPGGDIDSQSVLRRARETARRLSDQEGGNIRLLAPEEVGGAHKLGDRIWLKRIKQALRKDGFELAYQSIASLEGESRTHFEVTLRMLDERNQEILAAEFMPTAERHGLTQAIDRWVIKRALSVLARRQDHSEKDQSRLFIKLSEASLTSDDFITWVERCIKKHKEYSAQLVFEMKEPVVQGQSRASLKTVNALKKMGCKVALERLGSSTRSLALLDQLPLDFIKLDPSLTADLEADAEHREDVGRVMERAQEKGIKTIAERVEKANSMATLWQLGVNFVQGHYVQEPEVVLVAGEARLA